MPILLRILAPVLLFGLLACRAQLSPGASTAARLGYPASARLLILHADDVGMTLGVNRASVSALQNGTVSSLSLLAPAPFIEDAVRSLAPLTGADVGVHLTLTSDSDAMHWYPAAGGSRVPDLLDTLGRLPRQARTAAPVAQLEAELDAQIERVRALGVSLTHLDAHQGALFFSGAEVFAAFRRVAKRACLPIPVPSTYFAQYPYLRDAIADGHIPINDMIGIPPSVTPEAWRSFYTDLMRDLRPGVTVLLLHLGEDTPDERTHFRGHDGWDAAWRARDLGAISDPAFRRAMRDAGVRLVTWREVAQLATVCPD